MHCVQQFLPSHYVIQLYSSVSSRSLIPSHYVMLHIYMYIYLLGQRCLESWIARWRENSVKPSFLETFGLDLKFLESESSIRMNISTERNISTVFPFTDAYINDKRIDRFDDPRCTVSRTACASLQKWRKRGVSAEFKKYIKVVALPHSPPVSFVPWLWRVARGARANRREARPPHHTCKKDRVGCQVEDRLQRGRPKVNGILSRSFMRVRGMPFVPLSFAVDIRGYGNAIPAEVFSTLVRSRLFVCHRRFLSLSLLVRLQIASLGLLELILEILDEWQNVEIIE